MGNELNLTINIFDLIFVIFVGYFVLTASSFIFSLFELIGFIFTVIFSYKYYRIFADLLVSGFALSPGISQALGFFIAWLFSEGILFFIGKLIISRLPPHIANNNLNRFAASIPAAMQACIFYFLIIVTIFSLPVRPLVKEQILKSKTGSYIINLSHSLESKIKTVFGEAVNETLNFITIKEDENKRIDLGFKVPAKLLYEDRSSEKIMLALINKERAAAGQLPLEEDEELRKVAAEYASQMFANGFFSHQSEVDGLTPADRVRRQGIDYGVTGENLAYAPDVYVAHQGLMNSPGHRKNILSSDYGKVGVGIIDGGIYGKMFVQTFKD